MDRTLDTSTQEDQKLKTKDGLKSNLLKYNFRKAFSHQTKLEWKPLSWAFLFSFKEHTVTLHQHCHLFLVSYMQQ
jgi:hypothetical protein